MTTRSAPPAPPTKHQLALMIWLAVFPTLTVLNLALGDWLAHTVAGRPHLRARHHRGADRHLRPDAPAAPRPRTAPDSPGEHLVTAPATIPARLTGADDLSTSPPVVRPDSSVRRTARIVGVLFLAGYLAYGVGSLIATGHRQLR